ncbi:MAG: hypothetical protein AAB459_01865 [Patescibacteria group bacterium]
MFQKITRFNIFRKKAHSDSDTEWLNTADERLRKRLKPATPVVEVITNKNKSKIPSVIKFKLPKIKIPNQITLKLPKIKHIIISKKLSNFIKRFKPHLVVSLALILIITGIKVLLTSSEKQQNEEQKNEQSQVVKPDFNPAVSLNKKASGDTGLRYSPDKKSASFEDEYFSKKIIVSQQQLKIEEVQNKETLEKAANSIAQAYGLSITSRQVAETNSGNFYYYDIPDSEMQRGVLIFKNLLLFLISEKKLDQEDWQEYIKTLVLNN